MDTLKERTERLMHDRAKDAENAPVARLARGVHSQTLESRAIAGVRELPTAKPERIAEVRQNERPERVKDPEKLMLRPAGFEPVGHGPQIGGMGPGVITTQGWLNKHHADKAHAEAARERPQIVDRPTVPREPNVTVSDMRGLTITPKRLLPTTTRQDRDDGDGPSGR